MIFKKIEGLIAPVFTPMTHHGDLNLSKIEEYANDLIGKGLSGVFVLGSSGEGLLLNTDERKSIVEAWARYTNDKFKLLVHVGATSYREAQELAVHAYENNAYAISSMGPSFLQPKRVEELIMYCQEIASVVPELPFYYYHIPSKSGVSLNMFDFLSNASKKMPNLVGIKYTDSDFMQMLQCLALEEGKFDILHGNDGTLLCGLMLGVKGAIGTTYNFMPKIYYKIIKAFKEGNLIEARKYQLLSVEVGAIIARFGGGIIAGKAIEGLVGIDCGPCRWPLRSLSQAEVSLMRNELEAIHFFESIAN